MAVPLGQTSIPTADAAQVGMAMDLSSPVVNPTTSALIGTTGRSTKTSGSSRKRKTPPAVIVTPEKTNKPFPSQKGQDDCLGHKA
ncbi:hypothetical protein FRB96_007917 [Tulasnella sp. 330]|nr:hypothetical protein FRB96_007917 [Tulasnella sp. 330]KAG8878608.1 hypothetical protein FRB98_006045 [Tulasnella sp. 332]